MALRLFITYSQSDRPFRDELVGHLATLIRTGLVESWQEGEIAPGSPPPSLDPLRQADVILCLVSPDLLASDHHLEKEIPLIMARHDAGEALAMPILVRPVTWKPSFFHKLACLPGAGAVGPEHPWSEVMNRLVAALEEWSPRNGDEPSPLPETNNIIKRRNLLFTGREAEMTALRETLRRHQPVVLHDGPGVDAGGVGKSQIALEYLYRHGREYGLVWWVRAANPITLAGDFQELAEALNIQGTTDLDRLRNLRQWLTQYGRWLLILDQAQDADGLRSYLDVAPVGHVIITSRHPLALGEPLPIVPLGVEEASALLAREAGAGDAALLQPLATRLGGFPLALALAGAWLGERGAAPESLGQAAPLPGTPALAVATVVGEACTLLAREDPAVLTLLEQLCCLDASGIPVGILGPVGESAEALAILRRYALIDRKGDVLTLAPEVRDGVLGRLDDETRRCRVEAALTLVEAAFTYHPQDPATWQIDPLLPCLISEITALGERVGIPGDRLVALMSRCGAFHHAWSWLGRAEVIFRHALALGERLFPAQDPRLSPLLTQLGGVYQELGEPGLARPLFERALAIDVAAHGEAHPSVAMDANNLGMALQELGELEGARSCYQHALRIDEESQGKKHPHVAVDANNLAMVLQAVGKVKKARKLLERALAIDEKAYGDHHPNVAVRLNNLAWVLIKELKEYKEGRRMLEQAMAIDEKAFGKKHPNVAVACNNLGWVAMMQGDGDKARKLYERAEAIFLKFHGPDHPKTKNVRKNLAVLEKRLGKKKDEQGNA